MSHYRVLGIPLGASRIQIRAAYVKAARTEHPDLQPATDSRARQVAADRMCSVNEAWRVLGDPSRRRIYDAHRVAVAAGAAGTRTGHPKATATDRGPDAVPEASRPPRPERVPGRAPEGGHGNPLVLIPVGLFGLALVQLFAGLVVGIPGLLASGAVTFAVSVAAFVVTPLLVVATTRSDRRPVVG